LRVDHHGGDAEGELLDHADQHQRPVTQRVAGDQQKGQLPGQRHADEAVVVDRVGDGRRVVDADLRLHEIAGGKYKQAVDAGKGKEITGKAQGWMHGDGPQGYLAATRSCSAVLTPFLAGWRSAWRI